MTRKDYEQFAAAFARVRELMGEGSRVNPPDSNARTTLNSIENALCEVMQSDNPRFNVDRFMLASHAQKEN
jgi:hypothetical protein